MKCSLKDGLISILLIIFITPSEGVEYPLLLQRNPVIGEFMNFQQLKATINRLQDSFPNDGDSENNIHKIVKKQMAVTNSEEFRKKKRSVFSLPGEGSAINIGDSEKSKTAMNNLEVLKYLTNTHQTNNGDFERNIKHFFKQKRSISMPEKETSLQIRKKEIVPPQNENNTNNTQPQNPSTKEEKHQEPPQEQECTSTPRPNPYIRKCFIKLPDEYDRRCYYEFETNALGCIKLRHKRCPAGEIFSGKSLKCVKMDIKKCREKRQVNVSKFKRIIVSPTPPEDSDPSNEWLDATQGSRIPPEFKPSKKPELKIYHLIMRKKLNGIIIKKRDAQGGPNSDSRRYKEIYRGGPVKRQHPKTRRSKSFVIHIHKKAGKDESVAESEENDETEEKDEDEENDDEDEEEDEIDDEDDYSDDEQSNAELTQKSPLSSKESIKEFLKSAKDAVTNRARFDNGPNENRILQKNNSLKSKKSERSEYEEDQKKVLIDANIKVDSAISNALKCVLKGGMKENQDMSNTDNNMPSDDEALISDRGSQDQMDPELIRMYEHLLRHNPRVKRYFQQCKKELVRPRKIR